MPNGKFRDVYNRGLEEQSGMEHPIARPGDYTGLGEHPIARPGDAEGIMSPVNQDMAENFVDERDYGTQIFDYLFHGTSPSEYRGAHQDIDKLIANADANSILSQLFKMKVGRENIGVYRHLAPDSTVSILM